MNLVLRQATIINPASPHHNHKTDLFIRNGIIESIGDSTGVAFDREVAANGLMVSPGWVDPFVHFCDPGFEYKETLETGSAAAAAGGFTDVFTLPNTAPVVHNKAAVEYIVQRNRFLPATLHPIGAVTRNADGKDLSEMYDMFQSGAVAFGDGLNSVQNAGVLVKALQYLKAIDATIIQVPDDKTLNPNGLMHEGIVSTSLGLPGKPALAEELMIVRDLELARYTGSKIHITGISTAKGIELFRIAKAEGLPVSCSVTPYHVLYCDEDLANYDTNLKVSPPLRTTEDRQALRQALLDGTVDCIASHHLPQSRDEKLVEFEYASNGMIGLQTSFAAVLAAVPELTPERIVALFSLNARGIFQLQPHTITVGAAASLTLFSLNASWTFNEGSIRSKSVNTPFTARELKGRPYGIIHKDNLFLNEE
jgi:dihydroorotase